MAVALGGARPETEDDSIGAAVILYDWLKRFGLGALCLDVDLVFYGEGGKFLLRIII